MIQYYLTDHSQLSLKILVKVNWIKTHNKLCNPRSRTSMRKLLRSLTEKFLKTTWVHNLDLENKITKTIEFTGIQFKDKSTLKTSWFTTHSETKRNQNWWWKFENYDMLRLRKSILMLWFGYMTSTLVNTFITTQRLFHLLFLESCWFSLETFSSTWVSHKTKLVLRWMWFRKKLPWTLY